MSDVDHLDLGGYLLGQLSAGDEQRFRDHLEDCPECRAGAQELGQVAAMGRAMPPAAEPPVALEARTLAAVERAAYSANGHEPGRRRAPKREPLRLRLPLRLPLRGLAFAGAAAAVGVALFAVAHLTGLHGGGAGPHDHITGQDGDKLPIELAALGGVKPRAHAEFHRADEGVTVTFHSDHLPPPGPGYHYELWLSKPGQPAAGTRRISAGTFRPDAKGTTFTDLSAAADPEAYSVLAITRERTDGDPAPTFPDVTRSDWSKRPNNGR